jgi:hypothetical protein
VLVWRLNRWGRSVADLVSTLHELQHLGVGFVSLTEALDLTTPAGRAMAGLLAVFAEFEREILRERVRAGPAHAREKGKRLGRPQTAALNASRLWNISRRCQQGPDPPPVADRADLHAPYPECSTMKQRRKDPEREDRIHNEAIVDVYGPQERAMSGITTWKQNPLPVPRKVHCLYSDLATAERRNG